MTTVLTRPRRIAAARPFGPRDAGIPMTLDEFDASRLKPGFRYEVIHGVLVVSPIPLPQVPGFLLSVRELLVISDRCRPVGDRK